jgi:rhodanese-related sulfurtransferase
MPRSDGLVDIAARAVTIAAVGTVIGLVDSSIRGPVKTKLDAPPPLDLPSGGGPVAPVQPPSTPSDGPTPPTPGHPTPAQPTPAQQSPAPAQATPSETPAHAALPAGHITVAQAKSLFDRQGQFVDSRKREDYEAGHVKGAMRMELADFKEGIPAVVEFMVKDKEVIVYCIGGHCDESEAVGKQLNLLGFTKVYILHDGFPGWRDAGHPVETGPGQW